MNSVLIPGKDAKPRMQTTAPYAVEELMTARGNVNLVRRGIIPTPCNFTHTTIAGRDGTDLVLRLRLDESAGFGWKNT